MRTLRAATFSPRKRGSVRRGLRCRRALGQGLLLYEAAAAGKLSIAALRSESDGRVPAPLPKEAAVRDAQRGDRDGRAPPFSGGKPPRLTFPRPRRPSPHADFGRNGRPCAGMRPFASRSCCGWEVARSRAPSGYGFGFRVYSVFNPWLRTSKVPDPRSSSESAVNRNFFDLFPPNCLRWVRSLRRSVRGWRAHVERKRRQKAEGRMQKRGKLGVWNPR